MARRTDKPGWFWKHFTNMTSSTFWYRRELRLGRDRLSYVSMGHPLMVLFLPHLAMVLGMVVLGVVMLVGGLFGVRLGDTPPALGLLLIPFGGIFVVFLVPALLGRRRVLLDLGRRELVITLGLRLLFLPLIPLARRRRPLGDFSEVVLTREVRSTGKNSSTEVRAIYLQGPGEERLELVTAYRELAGRSSAERLARLLDVPLRDETAAEPVVRAACRLDEPAYLEARRRGIEVPETPPAGSVGRYQVLPDATRAEIPRPPWRGRPVLLAVLTSAVLLSASWDWLPARPTRPRVSPVVVNDIEVPPPSLWPWRLHLAWYWLVHGVLVASAAVVSIGTIVAVGQEATRRSGFVIRAGPQGLEIRRTGFLRWRRFRMPREELEELRIEEGKSGRGRGRLAAVSDRRVIRFAAGLTLAELDHLRTVILAGLSRD